MAFWNRQLEKYKSYGESDANGDFENRLLELASVTFVN